MSDQLATGRDRSKNETSAKSFAVINSDILIVGERKIQLEKYLKADFTVMSNKQSAVANPSPNIDRTSNKDAQQRQKRKWDGSPEAGSRSEQTHRGSYRYHSSSTSFSDYPDDSGHYSGRSDSYYDRRYKSEDYRNNRAGYH